MILIDEISNCRQYIWCSYSQPFYWTLVARIASTIFDECVSCLRAHCTLTLLASNMDVGTGRRENIASISCHKQSEAKRSSSHNIAYITLTLKSSLLSIRQAITELFCYRRHPALVITFIHSFHVIYLFISLFVYESFARCLWSSVSHHCFCLVYIMSVVCICNAI